MKTTENFENWGTPEDNFTPSIKQSFLQAVNNGYLEKLKAQGIGKGYSYDECLESLDNAEPIYKENSEIFREIKSKLKTEREKQEELTAHKKVVSTGDYNVKGGKSPAVEGATVPSGE